MQSDWMPESQAHDVYRQALTSNQLDERIDLLQSIYEQQPGYAHQAASQLLYDNLVDRAGQALANNDKAAAIADYRRATELPVEDKAGAEQALADLTR